ncbi:Right handed beta helix region [Amycolatopsis tolypomycina]|uniref:Right handed beta helix region n=1 Tax=Amycolatopsis tolypomycina TaxID=208445 RepID=A0A1H4XUN6_9PSEU|nr:right-handed parallel beta-helix repeat-containing protein [Amycolatopsis tolypomycina]SED08588.1 Right handed beta helix region [Amycolatopsis tolypomycina]
MRMVAGVALLVMAVGGPAAEGAAGPAPRTWRVGPHGQYATVQAAADVARPGDTVAIEAGVYPGGLTIRRDGAPGRPIRFAGTGGTAVLTGAGGLAVGGHGWLEFTDVTVAGSTGFGVYAAGAHDLVFDRFGVDGSRDGGLVLVGTRRVRVTHCDIRGTNARGTSADHEALSIASGSSDVEVSGCRVHGNGEEGIDVKYNSAARVKIHHNVVTGNRGPNIYVDSSSAVDVYANVVGGTREGSKAGIGLAVEDYSETRLLSEVRVFDNLSTGNAQAGLSLWVESTGTMRNLEIVNNTFAGNARGSVLIDADRFAGRNTLRNNVFGDGPVEAGPFAADHNFTGDPGFADPARGDYHLAAGSPAVDAGSPEHAPAFDLDGVARPAGAGFDIGAYERRCP